jgi:enoyl-CoA hydratase/carnithine racemase
MDIEYDVDEGIATVTLNRPEVMNAFRRSMVEQMTEALDRADSDDAVHSVIITGSGRAFCAGADLSGGDRFDSIVKSPDFVPRDGGGVVALRMFAMRKPVIAAVNGAAVGIGATITLPADFRLAASTARFGFVFARRGVTMEACSSWFLPRLVGMDKGLEWVYSGRVFDADEALSSGLVRSVHAADELIQAARSLALDLSRASSSVSIALCRQMMWRMTGAPHPIIANRVESRALNVSMRSADATEGVASFFERRAADFRGRVSTEVPYDLFQDWPQPVFSDWLGDAEGMS